MSPIFKTGAFIQQCFSVHPLCLSVKKLVPPDHVIIPCSSCNLAHRLTLRAQFPPLSSTPVSDGSTGQKTVHLDTCVKSHPTALRISAMDVVHDAVSIRCQECRITFNVAVTLFETHQR